MKVEVMELHDGFGNDGDRVIVVSIMDGYKISCQAD